MDIGSDLQSEDFNFVLRVGFHGNLTLCNGTNEMWTTNTSNEAGGLLSLDSDGDLVLTAPDTGKVLWASHTAGSGALYARMSNDGTFALYDALGNTPWSIGGSMFAMHTIFHVNILSRVTFQNFQ